jgi:hypothetical protein
VAATKAYLTTGEVAAYCRSPVWLVRRVVDALGEPVPRLGAYRLIPATLLARIEAEVRRRAGQREAAHAS